METSGAVFVCVPFVCTCATDKWVTSSQCDDTTRSIHDATYVCIMHAVANKRTKKSITWTDLSPPMHRYTIMMCTASR